MAREIEVRIAVAVAVDDAGRVNGEAQILWPESKDEQVRRDLLYEIGNPTHAGHHTVVVNLPVPEPTEVEGRVET